MERRLSFSYRTIRERLYTKERPPIWRESSLGGPRPRPRPPDLNHLNYLNWLNLVGKRKAKILKLLLF